uniref:CRAL/TRIO N-terminal domain-containing protein n=1 Tax=Populus alba TaxID=43335 RepID=A0A4U5MA03_POPAL|nr:hypothetical protein D5086_0000316830 [Populus alba]
MSIYCPDASIARYLRARNWNVKKALKMLKETLKWRAAHKPEEIRWGEVAHEAQTGKVYRSNYFDKHGRTVLVMRPSCQVAKAFLEPKTSNKVKEDDGGRQEDAFILDKSEFPLGSSTTGPGIYYFGTNFPPAVRTKDTAKLYLKEVGMNLFLKSFYVILVHDGMVRLVFPVQFTLFFQDHLDGKCIQ